MGRIKTTFVKHTSHEIFEKHKDKFTPNFSKNKQIMRENFEISSKKILNVITGYITKLKTQEQRK